MAISREEVRSKHTSETGHEQFSDIYGLICAASHGYILIDHTNCPFAGRAHEMWRQTYAWPPR